ncbi:MAG: YbhB/YbcL family Raf kinase inhibitor-like protein [Gemmatimonadetes bacterium]|uniref:YbhB/YbcL family Raf kinase inhibitor-like protein n=1 Tax=Candidatus Kutchimonas denitrificans TaxID=3056748 RepID=A0AAE4Z4B9_9BACT|nr:YbhB/YbcL family Raf kinase inhibitor-like protein [Gemmatimonadota bacterium]NIR73509.1 YbhB/YbcL family Raf kinase inhibitor-like protein [Candidatus Kutchimonas denitrificans]NIR99468.1 YbhB/YbcL family Raf kinase inhibitor-like protein [Gemmatimonadota bacterium]NIT65088.1 YbhB/YbcL family Raf kinase inhibitor-like protein [Gemmatimonadota bacterium]NIV23621.1 YbhB/YbcL family Raf kinase inhibitor-like protein [Gemmatimonadota bacterium]
MPGVPQNTNVASSLQLSSPAFEDGESIPRRFTCQGADLSPPLSWTDVPEGAISLALIVDDPDAPAGTWVHWVIYDIPAALDGLPEGLPGDAVTPQGARQGINDFRRVGYGGPCPPAGEPHRYYFYLYALDIQTGLPVSATKEDLLEALSGHVLGESQLMGRYERK